MLSVGVSSTGLNEREVVRVSIKPRGKLLEYRISSGLSISFKGTPL